MHGHSSKAGEKQGAHTLHQPCGVTITLFGFTDHTTSKYIDQLRKESMWGVTSLNPTLISQTSAKHYNTCVFQPCAL